MKAVATYSVVQDFCNSPLFKSGEILRRWIQKQTNDIETFCCKRSHVASKDLMHALELLVQLKTVHAVAEIREFPSLAHGAWRLHVLLRDMMRSLDYKGDDAMISYVGYISDADDCLLDKTCHKLEKELGAFSSSVVTEHATQYSWEQNKLLAVQGNRHDENRFHGFGQLHSESEQAQEAHDMLSEVILRPHEDKAHSLMPL